MNLKGQTVHRWAKWQVASPRSSMHAWVGLSQAVSAFGPGPALLPVPASGVLVAPRRRTCLLCHSSRLVCFLELIELPPRLQGVSCSVALSADGHS